ncbi:MAG: Crp/Fnr family transcriptional regulator [Chloroflexota bacterium]|nr:Crp/Fnr family transcriptional regulator [Chloroflexota bacterium]
MTSHALDWDNVPYFVGLNAAARQRVLESARQHVYQAGAVIFLEGDPCAGFYIILDGMVRLYRTNAEGRLHTLGLLRSPSTFNEVAAVDGGANPLNAVAVTHTVALVISHTQLLNLMATERTLLANMVQAMAHVNRDYLERLEDMTFRTIPSRLAKLFLREPSYSDQFCETPTQLTQEEIAAILGTTREVVGRAMRLLLNAGLLRKQGRYVGVADRLGLERLAETNIVPEVDLTRVNL